MPAQHYTCGGVLVDLARPHRRARPLCGGRGHPVGPARRQPAGVQQPARMPGVRRGGGAGTSSRAGTICPSRRRSAAGTKAASPTATRKSSSSNAGARSAASCGTSSASSARPSGSSGPSTASTCCARKSTDYYRNFRVTPDLIELRNLVEVADLIIRSALVAPRKPRAALHARLSRDPADPKDTVLVP